MNCTNLLPLVLDIQPEPCLERFVFDFRQVLRTFCTKNIYYCCCFCCCVVTCYPFQMLDWIIFIASR